MSRSLDEMLAAAEADPALAALYEEVIGRLQAGDSADLTGIAREHPEHAELLRRLLPALEALVDLGVSAARPPSSTISKERDSDLEPRVLGDYRIVRELGRGGMGIVYEAEQVSLGRRVALKLLPMAAAMDPRQIQRFRIEAQAAACLHHPHIVPVHGVGCERGVHYYAMQLIDGRSLAVMIAELRRIDGLDPGDGAEAELAATSATEPPARLLNGGGAGQHVEAGSDSPTIALPESASPHQSAKPAAGRPSSRSSTRNREYVRNIARMAMEAAEALDHAHARGILHRDIKPGNLLLDVEGRLWVTDFGLAQIRGDDRLTLSGDVLGTLRYMSPEQSLGRRVVIDGRTDVYSLGVTLYELLTLRPAAEGRDRVEILRWIADGEPPPLRKVNPTVPTDLETIVLKATAKDPASRYATAHELAEDLRSFLEDRPIRARRPGLLDRAGKWSRRHRSVVTTAVLLLVLGTAVSTWLAIRANDARQEADRRAAEAREVVDFLVNDLIGAAAPSRAQGKVLTVDQVLARADENIARKFADRPLIEAAIRHALAGAYEELGQYPKAELHATRAVELRLDGLGPEAPETISSQCVRGSLLCRQGRNEEARTLMNPILATARKVLGPGHGETMRAMNVLASALHGTDRIDEAMSLFQELVSESERRLGPKHDMTLTAKNNLAVLMNRIGNVEEAKALWEGIVAIQLREQPDDPPLQHMSNLAHLYRVFLGRNAEAADMYRRIMEENLRLLGLAHHKTRESIGAYFEMARSGLIDREVVRKTLEPIRDRSLRELGQESETSIALTGWLAELLGLLGQTDAAASLAARLPDTRGALAARMGLAQSLYTSGRRDAALVQLQIAETLRPRLVPAEDPTGLLSRNCLAQALREHGRLDESRLLLEQTEAEARRVLGTGPSPKPLVEMSRGVAQFLLGRWPGLAPRIESSRRPPASFTIDAPFRAVSPVADGTIAPGEYGPAVEATFEGDVNPGRMFLWYKSRSKAAEDLSVRIHTAYTDRSLFLAFIVRDQFLFASELNANVPTTNDCVEVFIDGDLVANDLTIPWMNNIHTRRGNREGFQLAADAKGHQYTLAMDFTNAHWKLGSSRTPEGYVVEFEIPLDLIDMCDGPESVSAGSGSELLVNFGFVDVDTALSGQMDSNSSDYGIFWAEDPALSPYSGGEDFWTVALRLVPRPAGP